MAKRWPERGIRIPLSEESWRLILRALDQLPSGPSVAPRAARLRGYIEARLPKGSRE